MADQMRPERTELYPQVDFDLSLISVAREHERRGWLGVVGEQALECVQLVLDAPLVVAA
jgi:hypothetical protein